MRQQGHTLLELLIALTLALFLSSVLIEIFVQCKKTYYLIQRLNAVQTSVRIAFNGLSRDIRMAGLIGCVRLINFFPLNTQLTPDNSLLVWQAGFATTHSDLPYLPEAKPHSDIILIQFLDPDTRSVKFAQGGTISLVGESPFHSQDKCLISDCQHAEAFQWGQFNLQHRYQRDSEVGFLNKIVYYIGNTGRLNHKGNAIFALYRRNLNRSAHNPIELVEGIEKMSVRLGVRNTANGRLLYMHPQPIKKWSDVRSVEITLVLQDKKSLGSEWTHVVGLRERGI
ncbi:prepilin-type N- cleavage/methylation domain protein [Candidatus Rickettsiella viridis]|uniref:Prepilin-type N-cleavage/methylation domain protein n=1 Tax=Candidatus Rickettsiella viridis TaxID=676208 RepID=A0A2Z5UW35_9COXI|nr:PilW family protein [Candidatus Rickettsiella viridis]BBB15664.1 prepilin-type N- cleavage/methylation domain protein [Candidatus Rickettsiella viridis]